MRHAFIVFDYENDLAHAKEIANSGVIKATAPAGLDNATAFKQAQGNGDAAVKQLIDKGLEGTSVTVVVIGHGTAGLAYVSYAIAQSIERQSGVLGVFVGGGRSAVPFEKEAGVLMEAGGYDSVDWNPSTFAAQVEDAATDWKRFARPKPLGSHG
jgi:hypothetical protein